MSGAIKKRVGVATIIVLAAAMLVVSAIFIKPREKVATLVNADKLMAGASTSGVWDTRFADKVMKTVFFALVLTSDEYTQQNAEALEALRSWAAREFHRDPRFLHPVILPAPVANSTFVNSSVYSLLASPYYGLRSLSGDFLSWRMEQFSQSRAFHTFTKNCFEFFGEEPEAAAMLARYQSDRAFAAIDSMLAFCYFLLALLISRIPVRFLKEKAAYWRAPLGQLESAGIAAELAYGTFVVAGFYFLQSVIQEALAGQSLLACLLSIGLGLYVLFPVKIFADRETVFCLRSSLTVRTVAACAFLFLSLLVVQLLNWLKQGSLTAPDPLTLIISGLTGDFIHEPSQSKKTLALVISSLWALALAFTLKTVTRRAGVSSAEVAKRLSESDGLKSSSTLKG
ncbi:MAG TPA: hypothetical protein PLC15_18510 [Candidatus Obscuribacter sp.]|nr:hypothetical protein [Candidatus Obscuribacter sp.]HMY53168.1 hypothetical protein [Candidatus Obscuribacter sp.]HNA71690.1 hypothetical protein [Candidatus Obscuribacter sp.]HNB17383.1 hypothetical protein [Candidatus Obscuribacter sp.]HND04643.1 hypothetical protein [Candidatus Obscuribacter sp.]